MVKENGRICDGVAWRVDVLNEKVELRCRFCNHLIVIPKKSISDERLEGKINE